MCIYIYIYRERERCVYIVYIYSCGLGCARQQRGALHDQKAFASDWVALLVNATCLTQVFLKSDKRFGKAW